MRRKGVLVLGMHRSGTSALAGLLTKVGVAGPSRPLPTNAYNEKGYFESRVICERMDRLLAAADSRWDDWRPLDLRTIAAEELAAARADLATAVREEFGMAPVFVVKDPRNVRAVPLWLDILSDIDAEPYALIPIRHPQAVALSLARRDQMPGDKATLLWIRHVLDAERFTRHIPRAFVGFGELLADPADTLDRLAEALGIEWPDAPRSQAEALSTFAEPGLVHHSSGDVSAPGAAGPARWYRPLMELVAAAMRSKPHEVDTAAFDALHARFTNDTAPFAHYFGVAEAALADKDRAIAELQQSLRRTQSTLGALAATAARPGGQPLGDIVEEAIRSQGRRLDNLERHDEALARRVEAVETLVEELQNDAFPTASSKTSRAG